MSSFVHLHVHSEFSLLDGLSRLDKLAARALELGMDAVALTDHGAMYGCAQFCYAAAAAGVKPIVGCEVYVAPRSRHQKESRIDTNPYHLVLLARTEQGYQNLIQLVSKANTEGFYYRPRVDAELLQQHNEGLIALSACQSGEVPRLIMDRKHDEAERRARWYQELFGRDHYYLEIQRHEGLPECEELNASLAEIGRKLDIPLVATNDCHYLTAEDAAAHELLLCIQTNTTLDDPKRMRLSGNDYYLRPPEEMAALFRDYPAAIENTLRVAELCNFRIEGHGYHLPIFEVPEGETQESYLRKLCEQGLRERYGDRAPELMDRLNYELSVIHQMGFDAYFLIVWDLVHFAKSSGMLVGPGRGSAAGSLVSYVLRITELEPISNGLIFERFLNPGRVTMPDIDLDFPDDRRDELIAYSVRKYGQDKVAQIITFGTMAARAAIRDAGRALGIELPEVDRVAKLVPAGPKVTIASALETVPELRQACEEDDRVRTLVESARALEGVSRHASTHAAGVLITDQPLTAYVPLQMAPRGEGLITQYTMDILEKIGLLKIDFLGLSTLTILDRCLKHVKATRGIDIELRDIPLDDPCIYELLSSGEVTGVFQVESEGMRKTLRDMKPTTFEDIVVLLSLYRPGPMQFIETYIARKEGREKVEYRHPALEPILKDTNGIIVYQEQIIRIATDLAGYTSGEADMMRRAVGKKKAKELAQQKAKFLAGAQAKGIPLEAAEQIFADIEYFANYGFNKAHSAAYAVITCQTAYLKAKYPVEYMAAMLSVERGNAEKVAILINECRRLGIDVLPPDVNGSGLDFTIEAQPGNAESPMAIRFGLAAIKNVGDGPIDAILQGRGDRPFESVDDFCQRVDLRQVNKRVLECLIKAGALDCLGSRGQLLAALDHMMSVSQEAHAAQDAGQLSLFGGMMASAKPSFLTLPEVPPIPRKDQLAWEKELLGLYITQSPLHLLPRNLDHVTRIGQIDETLRGRRIQVMGMVANAHSIITKKGTPMAFVTVEDLSGSIEVTVFPRLYEETKPIWVEDQLVVVKGKVDVRDERIGIICDAAREYDPMIDGLGRPDRPEKATPVKESRPAPERSVGAPRPRRELRDEVPISFAPGPADEPPEEPPLVLDSPPPPDDDFEEPPFPPPGVTLREAPAPPPVHRAAPPAPERHSPGVRTQPQGRPGCLHVVFRRSGDDERDAHKLGQVYRLLVQHPGNAPFYFYINSAQGRVQLEFPNVLVAASEGLRDELLTRFGPDLLAVEWASPGG